MRRCEVCANYKPVAELRPDVVGDFHYARRVCDTCRLNRKCRSFIGNGEMCRATINSFAPVCITHSHKEEGYNG